MENCSNRIVQTRTITKARLETYKTDVFRLLSTINLSLNSSNTYCDQFFNIFLTQFNKIFKVRKFTLKKKTKFRRPIRATVGICKSRDTLYDLYAQKAYNHNEYFLDHVKKYSKLFKKVCELAKALHIRKEIEDSQDKQKTVWKIINRETGKVKTQDLAYKLNSENGTLTSDQDVANEFEKFFTNIPVHY